MAGAWDEVVLTSGCAGLGRLLRGALGAAGIVSLAGLAVGLPYGHTWVLGVLPLACGLATAGRVALRTRMRRRRRAGLVTTKVLAVGSEEGVAAFVARTRGAPHEGWTVTAACTPAVRGPGNERKVAGVPVVGDLDAVVPLARTGTFDTIGLIRPPEWTPERLQAVARELGDVATELVIDPGLPETVCSRLRLDSLGEIPLLRLAGPRHARAASLVKATFDRCAALLILVLVAPLLIAIALAVVVDGRPVLFRQVRVGRGGRQFKMIKFRSMVRDAESLRAGLAGNDASWPLFKLRTDPRVTRVGQVLRRFSLDELPQLLNVLGGSMSLVGPRPALPCEAACYAAEARRRLLVKPGMTGLSQVSGRSNLSWEETLRLDLSYVDNGTLALDARILARTAGVVLKGDGAY
jgi:exopolysaccharide biosynthesis polyprenyl glycosylphosphotransferase